MKKFKNIFKLVFLFGALFFASCEDITDLDLTENPNYISPEQGDADFFMNYIQIEYAKFVEGMGYTASRVVRMDYMNGRDYANAYGPTEYDSRWRRAYQKIMMNIKQMNAIADEKELYHHKAMGQVMQAYTMMTLVDFFGDVPYTEMLGGDADMLNPKADAGADIYAAILTLLDEAKVNFAKDAAAEPTNDFFYNGDWGKWIKAANTMKMKAYLTTRLVDATAEAKYNAIVASGDYISSNDDDFQFRWGTNESLPDSRHPRYSNSYTTTGGSRYMSNSLMDYMTGLNDGAYMNPNRFDPRVLFYFYRQSSATPGQGGEPANEETIECSMQTAPLHYEGYTFCGVPKGWWGRDHGNDNGIPPDGFLRTLSGIYPAGGALDDLSYQALKNGAGNGGSGVTPILLASWTKFWSAEFKMEAGDDVAARDLMLEGMAMSWDKVYNFAPRTARFDIVFDGDANLPLIDTYEGWFIADITTQWDDAATTMDDKWNILAMQYFVASYGNGNDPYNFYRRTGKPTNLQPNIEPNPGSFIRSFFYPSNYTSNNSNATQKSGVDVQVFWDTNPASPAFPVSN